MVSRDDDGDLMVARRPCTSKKTTNHQFEDATIPSVDDAVLSEMHLETRHQEPGSSCHTTYALEGYGSLTLAHALATPLDTVGLQVWRGAALLTDYLLHLGIEVLKDATILELGTGVGLCSVAAAAAGGAACVYATDAHAAVLNNCRVNVAANGLAERVKVRQLDWMALPKWLLPGEAAEDESAVDGSELNAAAAEFGWTPEDVDAIKQRVDFLLAADVIYDDTLTEAFMETVLQLLTLLQLEAERAAARSCGCSSLRRAPQLLVALEKRECFTLRDRDVTAPAYDYWRTLFTTDDVDEHPIAAEVSAEGVASVLAGNWALVGRQLDVLAVPQRGLNYARGGQLELWELRICRRRDTQG